MNLALAILVVLIIGAVSWFALWPDTKGLAISLWASFGPYDTADEAEKRLRQACSIVFGASASEYEVWMQKHAENFREAERDERLQVLQGLMRIGRSRGPAFNSARVRMRNEIASEAVVSMGKANEAIKGVGQFEVIRHPDGTVKEFAYRPTRSQEEIVEEFCIKIGQKLLDDDSQEAKALCAYLNSLAPIKSPKDLGVVWGLSLKDETFRRLNDSWNAVLQQRSEDHPNSD